MEGFDAAAFSPPPGWAAPNAAREEASVMWKFISKDFLEQSTQQTQCGLLMQESSQMGKEVLC